MYPKWYGGGTGKVPTTKDPRPQRLSIAMAGAAHREKQIAYSMGILLSLREIRMTGNERVLPSPREIKMTEKKSADQNLICSRRQKTIFP